MSLVTVNKIEKAAANTLSRCVVCNSVKRYSDYSDYRTPDGRLLLRYRSADLHWRCNPQLPELAPPSQSKSITQLILIEAQRSDDFSIWPLYLFSFLSISFRYLPQSPLLLVLLSVFIHIRFLAANQTTMKSFTRLARVTPRVKTSLSAGRLTAAGSIRCASNASSGEELKKTPLYDFHVANGAKMVPFAGYSMPVQYSSLSLADSHHFTRNHASIFDVSHMVQHIFKGPDAVAFLEKVTPSAWGNVAPMSGKLTTFLWPGTGGIVDDTIVTRIGEDEFYVVTNGACLEKDTKYIDEQLGKFGGNVQWTRLDGSGLIALQGPQAAEILSEVLATDINLKEFYFGNTVKAELKLADGSKTHPVLISRGGYTGEDGFEISFNGKLYPAFESTVKAVESLMKTGGPERLQMAGLGARDSLRLEAGMCLYGHDLDDTTTPVEAGLSWIISPERRKAGGFHGAEVILPQLTPKSKGGAGVERRRVGFVVQGAPAREGAEIQKDGETIGTITSGVPSPTLGKNIAMGYIKDGQHKSGTEVDVVVRGRKRAAVVTKMPFTPAKYWKAPA